MGYFDIIPVVRATTVPYVAPVFDTPAVREKQEEMDG